MKRFHFFYPFVELKCFRQFITLSCIANKLLQNIQQCETSTQNCLPQSSTTESVLVVMKTIGTNAVRGQDDADISKMQHFPKAFCQS